ncbi:MAG: response regulator transcription factor [Phycisphaerales bacterium]|nr:response regulator transcription factor [Phycisphaerales bacterium]
MSTDTQENPALSSSDRAGPLIQIVARHALDRAAYRVLLAAYGQPWVLADADFGAPQNRPTPCGQPQVVICIVDAPRAEALEVLERIRRHHPEARLLIVSGATDAGHISWWSGCALDGYVPKDVEPQDLCAAVCALLRRETWFPAHILSLLEHGRRTAAHAARLSRREAELLPLLARGLALRDAAELMGISYKTADSYRTGLLRKLGVRDRVELARYAIRHHLVEP